MTESAQNKTYDTCRVGDKTYMKDVSLGPKAWGKIRDEKGGRFVDILEAKFSNGSSVEKKINVSK